MIFSVVSANAVVITVDDSGGQDYTTIQAAVNNATDGGTILVYPGTYTENVHVNKELTVISQCGKPDDTIVQAANSGDPVFHVTANNVTISGFNVTGGDGLLFDCGYDYIISDNIILDGGIRIDSCVNFTVINNTVISEGSSLFGGISSYGGEGILEDNEVFSCSRYGIIIENQAYCTVVNNTIYDNNVGIEIQDFANGYIYNNTIYENEKAGIEIGLTSYGWVANNIIYGNDEVGIRITDVDPYGNIYNNYFNNTVNAQIDASYSSDISYVAWNITMTVGKNIVGGPLLGGNYWVHPNGTGFSVDTPDSDNDGICDEQYNLSESEVDYLPLTIVIDDLMPVISITSPADETSTTASSIAVSGLVNGTGSIPVVTVNDVVAETTLLDFNGTFTATVPLIIGTNTIYANVTDFSGNTNTTSVNVTRISTDGGSGGGGSGGGATGEAFENILVKDAATSNVVAGELSRYEFSEEKCHIVYIQFRGVANAGKISTLIEILKDTSTLVDSPAPGIVYQNMNIWVGNVAFGDDKIEDAVIVFRVSKEWFSENSVDTSSIALYRYTDGKWNEFSTTNIDEDSEYIYFEAETPGFSPFAIVGFAEEDESVSIEDSPSPSEEDISAVKDEDTQPEPSGIPWISTGSLILILFGVHMLRRKRS